MVELVPVLFKIIPQDEDSAYFVYKPFVLPLFPAGATLADHRFGFFGSKAFILHNNFHFGKKFAQLPGQPHHHMMDLCRIAIRIKGFANDDGFDFLSVQVILQIGFQPGGRHSVQPGRDDLQRVGNRQPGAFCAVINA